MKKKYWIGLSVTLLALFGLIIPAIAVSPTRQEFGGTATSTIFNTGSLIFQNPSSYAGLAPGTDGQFLLMSGGLPAWGTTTTGGGIIAGTINQVGVFTGNTQIGGYSSFMFNSSTQTLTVGPDFLGLSDIGIQASRVQTDFSDSASIGSFSYINPTATSSASHSGLEIFVDTSGAAHTLNNGTVQGLFGFAQHSANVPLSNLYGAHYKAGTNDGTVTDMAAALVTVQGGGGVVQNASGVKVEVIDASKTNQLAGIWVPPFQLFDTVTTTYAARFDSPGDGLTQWTLASTGGNNYFAGSSTFGASTTPAYTVDVQGNVGVSNTSNSSTFISSIGNYTTLGSSLITTPVYAAVDFNTIFATTSPSVITFTGQRNVNELDLYGNSSSSLFAQLNNPFLVNKTGGTVMWNGILEGNNGAITFAGPNIDASSTNARTNQGLGTIGSITIRNGTTVRRVAGVQGSVSLQNSGATSSLGEGDAYTSSLSVAAGQTANTLVSYYSPAFTIAGSLKTAIGVKIDEPGAATTSWGIADDANNNYFGGSTIFGASTTPAYTADVHGTLSVTQTSTLATTILSGITGSIQCLQVDTAGLVSGSGNPCGTGSGGGSGSVGTSTVNNFAYYSSTNAVTGTTALVLSGNGITWTSATGTNLFVTNTIFISATTTNLAVMGVLNLPNNSITDAMVVPGLTIDATGHVSATALDSGTLGNAGVTLALGSFGSITGSLGDSNIANNLTISGGTIDNSPIGASTPSTGVFTNITSTNALFTSVTSTNLQATTGLITTLSGTSLTYTNVTSTNHFSTGLTYTNLSGTNATTTNLSATLGAITTLSGTSLTYTNITSTNHFSTGLTFTNLSGTNATSTNLFSTNAVFTSVTTTNFFTTNFSLTNLLATNATTTNMAVSGLFNVTGATFTGLSTADLSDVSNIAFLNGSQTFTGLNIFSNTTTFTTTTIASTTIANANITSGIFGSVTSTNFFTSNFSLTNLLATNVTSTNMDVTGAFNVTGATFTGLSTADLSDTSNIAFLNANQTFTNVNNFSATTTHTTSSFRNIIITSSTISQVGNELLISGFNATVTGTAGTDIVASGGNGAGTGAGGGFYLTGGDAGTSNNFASGGGLVFIGAGRGANNSLGGGGSVTISAGDAIFSGAQGGSLSFDTGHGAGPSGPHGTISMSIDGLNLLSFAMSTSSNRMNFGNTTKNPAFNFIGTGNFSVSGTAFMSTTTIVQAASQTNQVVCYLAGGTLGHCTSVVGVAGDCTCASN